VFRSGADYFASFDEKSDKKATALYGTHSTTTERWKKVSSRNDMRENDQGEEEN